MEVSSLPWKLRVLGEAVALLILYVALRVNYHHSPLPTTPSCWCLSYRVTRDDIEFDILATAGQLYVGGLINGNN